MQSKYQNIVIKVGTSTLAHKTGMTNIRNIEKLVKILSDIKNMGLNVTLVSSGAIGVGFGKLLRSKKGADTPTKQAAAAIGQCELMYLYDKLFSEYNHIVAQVLLTADAMESELRISHIKNTFSKLKEMGAIAIVNENDTVAVEEIEFGDNDTLSAIVAKVSEADALIILSDIDGLYDKNPKTHDDAVLINDVYEIDEKITSLAENTNSELGTGGMITKIKAGVIALDANIDMHIINGEKPELLYDILENKKCGTYFHGVRK